MQKINEILELRISQLRKAQENDYLAENSLAIGMLVRVLNEINNWWLDEEERL